MISGPADTQPDPASLPIGSVVAGRFELHRLLGEGGFGAVFAARDRTTGAHVALKVISASVLEMSGGRERFRREVDTVRKLSHPNIVRVFDAGDDEHGTLYIAFELLDGISLEQELERRGAMPPRRAANLAGQVLSALEVAHGAGVIHRDIKPANVFLVGSTGDQAKLIDFGIAKSTNPNSAQGITKHGMMLGTPAYMAPEQLFGKALGPPADLFAFGIVMAEMLAGRALYADDVSPLKILQERINAGRVPVPDVVMRSALGEVIAKALNMDAPLRYQTAAEMRMAVEAASARIVSETFTPGLITMPSAVQGGQAQSRVPSSPHAATAAQISSPGISSNPGPGLTAFGSSSSPQAPPFAGLTAPGPAGPPGANAWMPVATTTPKKSSSGLVLFFVLLVLAAGGVGAGIVYLIQKSSEPPPKKRPRVVKTEEARTADVAPTGGAVPTPKPTPTPQPLPTFTPVPQPSVKPETPREASQVVACKGVSALSTGQLKKALVDSGLSVTGDYTYCAGTMVNFVCMDHGGKGFTLGLGGGAEGGAVLVKVKSGTEPMVFVMKEASEAKEAMTLAYEDAKVLRLEMPAATAKNVLSRICK